MVLSEFHLHSIFYLYSDSTISVVEAYGSITDAIETLSGVKLNIDTYHKKWFKSAIDLAASIGTEPKMPRITNSMQHRSNIPGENEEIYFKRNITLPCLNEVFAF